MRMQTFSLLFERFFELFVFLVKMRKKSAVLGKILKIYEKQRIFGKKEPPKEFFRSFIKLEFR